ncbi:MAG: UTRA domain-containing protein [Proteobacteria bacterium]|nr:UTRA domain-containing protein [Pseudomonadota bacterium]
MTSTSAKKPDEKPGISLHQRILSDIQDLILSGKWEPGRRIPVEEELMKRYKCSRMTVHKVLTQLAHARLVERRRKLGTFVSRPHSQAAVLTISDIKSEVERLGQSYSYEILRRVRRRGTQEDRARLNIEGPVLVLEVVTRHFAGFLPFCYEERLINLDAVPAAASVTFSDMAPGRWLLHTVPWTKADHVIRAAEANTVTAAALKIRQKTPLLTISRTTRSSDSTPLTFVRLAYPADMHELVATFSPGSTSDSTARPAPAEAGSSRFSKVRVAEISKGIESPRRVAKLA